MARWQWLGLVVGTVVVLGATVVVIDAAIRFYNTVALVSPLLAQVVLWVGIALALGIVGIALYYGWLFLRPRRRRRPPVAPRHPGQAASHTLEMVQRQVEHIQDQVARQALLERSQALLTAMDRGDLTIAVFGVGSAGKTSLINALLGEPLGAVGAPMGTTQTRQDYVWPLPHLPRRLVLIDTPGLSEVGVAGTLREQAAREIATEADLILFVIDDDLRQAEHGVLMPLLAMGKRAMLVLNKADRYPGPEVDMLLDRLRSRVVPPLSADDVVAIAAAPQPLPKAGGGWLQMRPNLDPLLARLMDILRQEGDTLVADNILLQTQQLSDTTRRLIDTQRQTQADAIIDRYQWIGAGAIAATPLPGFDFLATAAVNAQMVVELSRVYGYEVSLEEGKALAISLAKTLGGLGLVKGAVDLLALGLQTNVATVLAGRALKGVSGAYLTRVAGKSFVEYFRHNQDWGDGGMGAVVEEQFRLNQREAAMKAFVQDAIAKVVSNLPSEG